MQLLAKTGWLLLLCFYSLLAQLHGWQGVALYMLNISFKETVNPEIQLEQYLSDALTTESLNLQQKQAL